MDKRYQVFVSSTFEDLKVERSKIMQTLLQMKCLPSGMEMFPALDEDQWGYIKRSIDDCDYYILVIAGRYGSVDSTNISYTEKEFDYAVSRKKPVLALLHENPENITLSKIEKNHDRRKSLEVFRQKVKTGRLIKTWKSADDLSAQVVLGMMKTIERFPAHGWVKGDQVPNEKSLEDIIRITRENELLREKVSALESGSSNFGGNKMLTDHTSEYKLADLNEALKLEAILVDKVIKLETNWKEIFVIVGQQIEVSTDEYYLKKEVDRFILEKANADFETDEVVEDFFKKIIIQFRALNYIEMFKKLDGFDEFETHYRLTASGSKALLLELAIKTKL